MSLFGRGANRLSLGDISERTGLVKSSALRLLVSLQKAGYLTMTPDKLYIVGPEAFRVGHIYQQTFSLEGIVRPVLKKMVDETRESASFFRREGNKRVCVFREDCDQLLREHVAEGDAVDIDRGAAGHVLTDYDDLRGDTPATLDVLHEIPVASVGERGPGIGGISVPIFAASGEILGALVISGPSMRFTEERMQEMSPLILAAAASIGEALGSEFYSAWPMRL
ncbi:IclR family transcriptional regulator [Pelagibaca abyssi]|nr:IclR family transcriptional regulator [Salipiger abyssi]